MFTILELIYLLFSLFCFSSASTKKSKLPQSLVTLQFPIPGVAIATETMPNNWDLYFLISGLPVSFSGTWSRSVCKVNTAFYRISGCCANAVQNDSLFI